MSDEGEKTCPLCAEEMDLTDQQLRPCKCGYDICVWCWHHIMDMAEKDDTEGRCPACRTPYNKEKIVGTASKCERLVAEMSVEKKQKSQKGKTKASEGRKHLSSVRVIQRNLVYIVGLPLNLADEELLQRKEYFGQYGKVLKVSISRTAAGAIQHFANNTCSVYITYSKEDGAVRSIQSVHGFVLEGRPLKACFGTTKYCHAWLRSMPCTNPDCLYLHEFGSQEDSFTKDEIISEYTRGRVQQVTGATNELQRRSGNILPPAADDYSNNSSSSWGKPVSKTTTNDSVNSKGSPPNSSSGRSLALPAAASWGTRASNSQPFAANIASPNEPSKQKVETYTTQSSSTAAVSPSSHNNEILKKHIDENPTSETRRKLEHSESVQHATATDHRENPSEIPVEDDDVDVSDEERIHQLSFDMSAISIFTNDESSHTHDAEKLKEPLDDNNNNNNNDNVIGERSLNKVQEAPINEVEADLLTFNTQRLSDPEVVTHNNHNTHTSYTGYVQNTPQSSHLNSNIPIANGDSYFHATDTVTAVSNGDRRTALDLGENSIISNILSMDFDPWDKSLTSPQNLAKFLGNSDKQQASSQRVSSSRKTQNVNQSRFSFAREDDKCEDRRSNFNFQNFSTDAYPRQHTDSNGFYSFNYEESDRTAGGYPSMSPNKFSASRSQISAPPGFMGPSRAPPPGFASSDRIEQTYDNISGNNHMFDSSFLLRKVNQAPGAVYNDGSISELEFMDPAILAVGGRVPSGVTSPCLDMRSNYSTQHSSYETDSNRLRLLMQRSFTQQNLRFNELGGDNNNLSYPQRTDSYGVSSRLIDQALLNNNHRSHYQQQQVGNLTNFQQARMTTSSNGHCGDGWNEVQNGNDIAMAEILRNERLGSFNKYYSGYEDTKFRVPSSGDLYNRMFGI